MYANKYVVTVSEAIKARYYGKTADDGQNKFNNETKSALKQRRKLQAGTKAGEKKKWANLERYAAQYIWQSSSELAVQLCSATVRSIYCAR